MGPPRDRRTWAEAGDALDAALATVAASALVSTADCVAEEMGAVGATTLLAATAGTDGSGCRLSIHHAAPNRVASSAAVANPAGTKRDARAGALARSSTASSVLEVEAAEGAASPRTQSAVSMSEPA